jgi:HEAT repeat protein
MRGILIGLMFFAAGCSRKKVVTYYTVPAMINDLKSPDAETRATAAWALKKYGPGASNAVPALTEALKDSAAPVRAAAAHALAEIGPSARPAIPALRKNLEDSDAEARAAASYALGRLR